MDIRCQNEHHRRTKLGITAEVLGFELITMDKSSPDDYLLAGGKRDGISDSDYSFAMIAYLLKIQNNISGRLKAGSSIKRHTKQNDKS